MGEGGGKVVGYLHVSLRVFRLNQQRNRVFKRVPACDCVVSLTYACSKRFLTVEYFCRFYMRAEEPGLLLVSSPEVIQHYLHNIPVINSNKRINVQSTLNCLK